ncbi:MAG: response regulator [Bacteroidota bacterium]
MKNITQNPINIVILEDNEYYNKLLTKRINQKMNELSEDNLIPYFIKSYSNYSEFLSNFKTDTHVAFIDFFLDDEKTGLDVLYKIKKNCVNCKVIILSDHKNFDNLTLCLNKGASGIIFKDDRTNTLCDYILDEQVKNWKYEA